MFDKVIDTIGKATITIGIAYAIYFYGKELIRIISEIS